MPKRINQNSNKAPCDPKENANNKTVDLIEFIQARIAKCDAEASHARAQGQRRELLERLAEVLRDITKVGSNSREATALRILTMDVLAQDTAVRRHMLRDELSRHPAMSTVWIDITCKYPKLLEEVLAAIQEEPNSPDQAAMEDSEHGV